MRTLRRQITLGTVLGTCLAIPALGQSGEVPSFTDRNGATYTFIGERRFTDKLDAALVEIENNGSVILMEIALDCVADEYAYLGMIFDLPLEGDRSADIERVRGYSDSVYTDRIGGLQLVALDASLENDSVIALVDMGCGR